MRTGYDDEDGSTAVLDGAQTVTAVKTVYNDVGLFLRALDATLYADARNLFQLHKNSGETQKLVDDPKITTEFLNRALETLAPAKDADSPNPTLYYFIQNLIGERQPVAPEPVVRVPCATETKEMVWLESTPQSRERVKTAVDRAIGSVYITMASVAAAAPCNNPDAGPIAKAGCEGYNLSGGNMAGLSAYYANRVRSR